MLFYRRTRLHNNTHTLIANMYRRHTEEHNAGMNQMPYLKVLPLSGEILFHCEDQTDLLVH